ncbi:MAG: hypothetical protein JWP12_3919 [Bacteroidetes bacterium]|nr:hypothetical protein [Bacteroidota bacterium]
MKKIILRLSAVIFLSFQLSVSFAQAPQKMSYQAVIRNAGNALVTSSPIGMQISILQGSPTGTAVYVETQMATTNTNGLVTIEIGNGTPVTGTFSSLDWSAGPYFIMTETDPTGGTTYTITGTTQLMSVPYALYAATSGNGAGPAGPQGSAGVDGINGNDGANGLDGATGPTGVQGPMGPMGMPGMPGTPGTNGVTGATGAQGPAGADGVNGNDGADGLNGNDGVNGTNGIAGATGPTGAQGLMGPMGMPGTPGADGATGATGIAGATGATGTAGSPGSMGMPGMPGTPGANGAAGATGATGIAGATGATGAAGSPGSMGMPGMPGTPGANGAAGATGATGATGIAGATGAAGSPGSIGMPGMPGTPGANGAAGATGVAGATGADGAAGATGTAGATGATGATGLLANGAAAGNTPYWNGTSWITNSSNIYNNGGSIGIGTTTPSTAKLVIAGSAGSPGIDLSSTDQYANLRVIQNTNGIPDKDMYIGLGSGTTSKLHFYSNNAELMTLAGSNTKINGQLEIATTTGAILLPRLTAIERTALTAPVPGMMIYNSSTGKFQGYATALGVEALDQSATISNSQFSGSNIGQSFIAGVTGELSKVDVTVSFVSTAGSCSVNVYAGTGSGGTLLGSSAAVTISSTGIKSFVLTGINVTAGNTYSFILVNSANCAFSTDNTNSYPSGSFTTVIPTPIWDFWFKTYIKPAVNSWVDFN